MNFYIYISVFVDIDISIPCRIFVSSSGTISRYQSNNISRKKIDMNKLFYTWESTGITTFALHVAMMKKIYYWIYAMDGRNWEVNMQVEGCQGFIGVEFNSKTYPHVTNP